MQITCSVRRRRLSGRRRFAAVIVVVAIAAGAIVSIFVFLTGKSTPTSPEDQHAERLDKLRSVPYTAMTDYEADPAESGVRVFTREKSYHGYNIHCSRVAPEIYLTAMDGSVVHTWSYPVDEIWVWDHATMQGNGDVMVISKFKELLRLTWESELVWRKRMDVHHDIAVLPDGTFYAIIRGAELHRGLVVRFPSIVHFSPDGEEIDRWYAYEHLDEIRESFDQRSFLDTILDTMRAEGTPVRASETIPGKLEASVLSDGRVLYDYFHLNTLTILPGTPLGERDARFKAGSLLICFRNVNQIAVLDRDTWEILWVWGEGNLEWPHHPSMVPNGNVLVFDNGVLRRFSRVLEVNPATGDVEWEYVADPPESFYTYEKGSAQRLPNGNTLICDGDNGRAFEVTREGEIVWEWLNPEIRKGHRVQIYRMMRFPPGLVEPLLN
jgi:hypothetical protein